MKHHKYFSKPILLISTICVGLIISYKMVTVGLDTDPLSPEPGKQIATAAENRPELPFHPMVAKGSSLKENAKMQQTPEPAPISSPKPTRLKIKLKGTVLDEKGKDYAVIESMDGRQASYGIGDVIENATVKLVLRKKIVLHVNGKDEILEIEKEASRGASKSEEPDAQEWTQSKALSRAEILNFTQNLDEASNLEEPDAQEWTQSKALNRAEILNYAQDLDELLQGVTFQRYVEKGKPTGLILSRISPRSILRKIGLRDGDIVKKIEGKSILSLGYSSRINEILELSPSVTLEIVRKGKKETINYQLGPY